MTRQNLQGVVIVVLAICLMLVTGVNIEQQSLISEQLKAMHDAADTLDKQTATMKHQQEVIEDQREQVEKATVTMKESTRLLKLCGDQI